MKKDTGLAEGSQPLERGIPSDSELSRGKIIIRTSMIGIIANLFLAGFKAVIGLLAHSIAIVLDAVNNLSDAASSLITMIGTRLAGKAPDKKHPFGHGRIEYLSAMIIAVIVLFAGLSSLVESVKKILQPEMPDYSVLSLVIIVVAVVVKILLGRYVKTVGKKVNSDALINSGEDARLDAVISASTLAAAVVFMLTGLSLEAWLGAVISLLIVRSGISMLWGTISHLLGEPADPDLVMEIGQTVRDFPEVEGAYDLVLNNYGPDTWNGSIHIEVPDTFSADQLDQLLRRITLTVFERHRVILTAIGVYSINTKDPEAITVREKVRSIALAHPHVLQMHGFYLNPAEKSMRFDLVISLDAKDRPAVFAQALADIQAAFPDYRLNAVLDTDFCEESSEKQKGGSP